MHGVSKVFLVFLAFVSFFEPAYSFLFGAFLFLQLYLQNYVTGVMPMRIVFLQSGVRLRRIMLSGGGEYTLSKRKLVVVMAILALVCLLIGVVVGQAITTYRISGKGNFSYPPKIGVYADSGCSVPITLIDWGTLWPGDVGKKLVYVRNEGTGPVTLTMAAASWYPSVAQHYLSLTWDYAGQAVAVNAVVAVTFSLAVSSNLTNASGIFSFSFDVVLTVSG